MQRKINWNFNFLFQLKILINVKNFFSCICTSRKIFILFGWFVHPHLHLMELKNWPERLHWFQIFLNLVMLGQCLLSHKHWQQIALRFWKECYLKTCKFLESRKHASLWQYISKSSVKALCNRLQISN